jgi:hypothetical protein
MLDQLIKLVQQNADDTVIKNPAIPNEKNQAVINDLAQNISGGLASQVKQGNLQDVMGMFKNGNTSSLMNNPVVSGLIAQAAGSLTSKFGLSPQIAQQVTSALLPKVMGQFVNKTNDPNDNDFDLQDVMKNLGGGGVGDMLGKMGGSGGLGGLGKIFG